MPVEETRILTLDTIPDAISLMNESSRGTSVEYHMDFFSFLVYKGYWNFSSNHSLIRYVDGTAAAVILTCTDDAAHDAYIAYWGVIPKFRSFRMAQSIFELCCSRLLEDGYQMLYGTSLPERPVKRYRFIQELPQFQLFDMQSESPILFPSNNDIRIQSIDPNSIASLQIPSSESVDWTQRPSFLRRAASTLKFFGAFFENIMKAYAVIRPDPSGTATLIDLRCSETDLSWGQELLRRTLIQAYPPPFVATNVVDQSYSHQLLTAAGFNMMRQFHFLGRDLRKTSTNSAVPSY